MGNAQSANAPQHQLRTTPSSADGSSADLLSALSDPPGLEDSPGAASAASNEDVVLSTGGNRRSRREARQRLRSQLFSLGNDSTTGDEASPEEGASAVPAAKDRLSRSGSLISHLSSARGSSTRLSCLGDSRLSLVTELFADDPSSSSRTLAGIEERTLEEGITPLSFTANDWKTDGSERPAGPKARRRSMFPPGIATRGDKGQRLRKPKPLGLISQHAAMSYPNSPFSNFNLAALDLADDARPSMSENRVMTPCDLDYSHLRGLKPGTLRITNGAASPAPSTRASVHRFHSTGQVQREEDYFPFPYTISHRQMGSGSKGNTQVERSPEFQFADPKPLEDFSWEPPRGVRPHISVDTKVQAYKPPSPKRRSVQSSTQTPDRTSTLAEDYMTELPLSPYVTLRTPALREWATRNSKQLVLADGVFDDEGIAASPIQLLDQHRRSEEASSRTPAQLREDTFKILTGEALALGRPSPTASSAVSRCSSMGLEASCADVKFRKAKPLAKADSGYSSNASLRSLHQERAAKSGNGPSSSLPGQTLSADIVNLTSDPEQPAVPEKTPPPLPPKAASSRGPDTSRPHLPSKPSVRTSHEPVELPGSMGEYPFPASDEPPAVPPKAPRPTVQRSGTSSGSVPTSDRPRKLRKSRPSSTALREQVTVQGQTATTQAHVPPLPSEVVARHTERLNNTPGLGHASPRLQHSRSFEGANARDCVLAKVTFPGSEEETDEPSRVRAADKEGHRRGLGLFSRSSSRRDIKDQVSEERPKSDGPSTNRNLAKDRASLGGLRASLRTKSYNDANLTQNRHRVEKHPERTGRDDKARAMVGMDEEAAAAFARERSRDASRPATPKLKRPRSMCGSEFRGGRSSSPGKAHRREPLLDDAPPVPSLPPVLLNDQKLEHTIAKSASSSVETPDLSTRSATTTSESEASPQFDPKWAAHEQLWRQRRKGASAMLQQRNAKLENKKDTKATVPTASVERRHPVKAKAGKERRKISRAYVLDMRDVPIAVEG